MIPAQIHALAFGEREPILDCPAHEGGTGRIGRSPVPDRRVDHDPVQASVKGVLVYCATDRARRHERRLLLGPAGQPVAYRGALEGRPSFLQN